MKAVTLSALLTDHFYSQEISLILISFRSRVEPRAIVCPEGLKSMKNPNDPNGN